MPTHKGDLTRLTVTQLQQLCGRKPETIRRLLDGLTPVQQNGRSVLYDARAALDRIYGGEGLNPQSEKARKDCADADLKEQELAKRRGELIERQDFEAALLAVTSPIGMQLDALPSKATPEVRAARTDAEGEAILRRYTDQARTELADHGGAYRAPRRARSRGAGARGAAPAAAADGLTVGGR